jgi:hypothetical protein
MFPTTVRGIGSKKPKESRKGVCKINYRRNILKGRNLLKLSEEFLHKSFKTTEAYP